MYVEFLGALLISWKMSSTQRLARYAIVSSKLFVTAHFFLARKYIVLINFLIKFRLFIISLAVFDLAPLLI